MKAGVLGVCCHGQRQGERVGAKGDDSSSITRTQGCQPGVGDGKGMVAWCSAAGSEYSIQSSSLRLSLSLIRLNCGGIVLSSDQGGIKGRGEPCLIGMIIHDPPTYQTMMQANQNQRYIYQGDLSLVQSDTVGEYNNLAMLRL